MSDSEGLMWRLEKDPYLSSTFGTVSILDRPPDFDRLRARMERAVTAVPRLGWRVQSAPNDVSTPVWVDDPEFDIDYHVRRVAVAKPGTMREVLDLAALLVADPFERTRPLWQFFVIEGMKGGKAALVQKMHHTITDGEGGIQMAVQFLDFERDAPHPDVIAPPETPPAPPPHPAGTMLDLMAASVRMPFAIAEQVRDLLADPSSIPQAGSTVVSTVKGLLSQLTDTDKARSPLWTDRSLRRRVETARAPFRATRDAARRLGGTLNTAFLAAAAHAAGSYHDELGAPVETLRASMAVSTRTSDEQTNAFSLARFDVPTAPMPIAERFQRIQSAADGARGQAGIASLGTLATIATALPTSLVTRIARQQTQTVDFATSNVKGSPVPVYIAGAKLVANYPIGPLAGVAFNLTLLSYDGSLDMGINVDTAAVAEPALLSRLLADAFVELVDAE